MTFLQPELTAVCRLPVANPNVADRMIAPIVPLSGRTGQSLMFVTDRLQAVQSS